MKDTFLGVPGRILGIAWLETRLNLLSPGPWVVGLVLSLLGYLQVRTSADPTSFRLGWTLAREMGPYTVVLLLFLAASFAYRPWRYDITELQDSKRVGSEELILGRWLGMVAGVLAPLLVEYGVTALGQRIHAKPPVVAAGYFYSLARLLPSVLFFATLSFMLVNLTGILVLGAGLTALLWAVILFGRDLLPTTLWMDLAQNGPVYLGATLGLLLLLLLTYRSTRRARRNRLAPVLTGLITVILTATLLRAAWAEQVLPGRRSAVSTWQRLRVPALAPGAFARGGPGGRGGFRRRPVPNLAWTDLHGKRLSLAALRGKPALVVLFQPHDSELLSLLHRLSELRQEFPADRLGMIVLCMAEDLEIAREAAALAGPAVSRTLPVVTDWGVPLSQNQTFYDDRKPTSVAAFQLRVQGSPVALLLDRDGREQTRDLPLDAAGWQDLRVRVRTFLEEADGEVD